MNFMPAILIGLTAAVALSIPTTVHKESERESNMCAEVAIELIRSVEEGYLTEEEAERIGGRCFQIYGERY